MLGLKLYDQAETSLRRALALQPDDTGTLNNLGNAISGSNQHAAAIECYRRVVAIQPNHVAARFNMGRSLAALDRLEDAVAEFRTALGNAPTDTDADRIADIHASMGEALVALGRYDEAQATCREIANLRPGPAAWNESLILLLRGQFAEGWQKYEGRWQVADHDPPHQDARVPTLTEVAGKQILIVSEQGHGDMIQFARYIPLLARHGAHVCLQTYIELQALMQTLDGVETVIAPPENAPQADIITPLLSLPLVFGTDLRNIPADVPYLHAPPDRLARWQQRLGPRTRSRIGLAWWGSQHIAKRSLPVEALLPMLAVEGIELHSLQKEVPSAQRAWLDSRRSLIDHSAELGDFADTAALISLLDLVVTIDTSVAHLAGALGKPVWIVLQHSADWRWLLDRADSPWYPTARLFRQRRRGDWNGVVADVMQALSRLEHGSDQP